MKRILVVDESEAVRETLALILGREFVVVQRPSGKEGFSFADVDREVDLLILGVAPGFALDSSVLIRFASQVPLPVLFLVDSKSALLPIEAEWPVDCLAKPFNPYELREKVGRLLSRQYAPIRSAEGFSSKTVAQFIRYLEFPFLPRSVAHLARRFASTNLPIHIYGEIGCGQEQVARAMGALKGAGRAWIFLNASEITPQAIDQKIVQRLRDGQRKDHPSTLFLDGLETLSPQAQSSLLEFLEGEQENPPKFGLITASREDLLEKVYRGAFLEPLYHKVAVLTLRLPPLRERQEDLAVLAAWFANQYATRLDLPQIRITPQAIDRLRKYLWFGNLHELEAVVARTLATQRKEVVEASDWTFEFTAEGLISPPPPSEKLPGEQQKEASSRPPAPAGEGVPGMDGSGDGRAPDIKILIHELAHELKNPMVTIKTFAQLLGERYDDETFRARFQDIVGHDIERIDDLLEVMIEFADFSKPTLNRVVLNQNLRSVLDEIASECAKREARIRWNREPLNGYILADEAQLKYALKNLLLSVLSQMRMNSEIEIDMEKEGCVNISYIRDGGHITPLTHYLSATSEKGHEAILPLRILLAKHLIERNGGEMIIDSLEGEKELLRLEFPVA